MECNFCHFDLIFFNFSCCIFFTMKNQTPLNFSTYEKNDDKGFSSNNYVVSTHEGKTNESLEISCSVHDQQS